MLISLVRPMIDLKIDGSCCCCCCVVVVCCCCAFFALCFVIVVFSFGVTCIPPLWRHELCRAQPNTVSPDINAQPNTVSPDINNSCLQREGGYTSKLSCKEQKRHNNNKQQQHKTHLSSDLSYDTVLGRLG